MSDAEHNVILCRSRSSTKSISKPSRFLTCAVCKVAFCVCYRSSAPFLKVKDVPKENKQNWQCPKCRAKGNTRIPMPMKKPLQAEAVTQTTKSYLYDTFGPKPDNDKTPLEEGSGKSIMLSSTRNSNANATEVTSKLRLKNSQQGELNNGSDMHKTQNNKPLMGTVKSKQKNTVINCCLGPVPDKKTPNEGSSNIVDISDLNKTCTNIQSNIRADEDEVRQQNNKLQDKLQNEAEILTQQNIKLQKITAKLTSSKHQNVDKYNSFASVPDNYKISWDELSSKLQARENINKNCQSKNTDAYKDIEELRQKNYELQERLDNEVEMLIKQNNQLLKRTLKLESKVEQLARICNTTSRTTFFGTNKKKLSKF